MSFNFYGGGGGGAATVNVDGTAGESIAQDDVVYMAGSGPTGTAGRFYRASNAATYTGADAAIIGLATAAAGPGDSLTVQTGGAYTMSGLTADKVYSLGVDGALALVAGGVPIGISTSTTELLLSGAYTTSGLTAGASYQSDGSGGLTAVTAWSTTDDAVGYAVSTTSLALRSRAGALAPANSYYSGPTPTLYYRFNADTGATATDSSGNSYDGTMPVGSYAYVTGQTIGSRTGMTVLDWTPTDGGLPLPAMSGAASAWSLSMWLNADSFATYNYWFTCLSAAGTGTPQTAGRTCEYYAAKIQTYQGAKVTTPGGLNTSQWYHLCWVIDGALIKIFVDGVQVLISTGITSLTRPTGAGECALFCYASATGAAYQPNGKFAEIAMFDAALTDRAVTELAGVNFGNSPLTIV